MANKLRKVNKNNDLKNKRASMDCFTSDNVPMLFLRIRKTHVSYIILKQDTALFSSVSNLFWVRNSSHSFI